jgi:hypothetical protein
LRKQFELFLDVIIEEQRKKVNRRTNTHIWRSINRNWNKREYRYFGLIAEKFFRSFSKIVVTFRKKSRNRVSYIRWQTSLSSAKNLNIFLTSWKKFSKLCKVKVFFWCF